MSQTATLRASPHGLMCSNHPSPTTLTKSSGLLNMQTLCMLAKTTLAFKHAQAAQELSCSHDIVMAQAHQEQSASRISKVCSLLVSLLQSSLLCYACRYIGIMCAALLFTDDHWQSTAGHKLHKGQRFWLGMQQWKKRLGSKTLSMAAVEKADPPI